LAEVEADYLPMTDPESTTQGYIALLAGQPIGFIQSYVVLGSGDGWWEQETDPGARGIDQFLADAEHLGRGLGSTMVRAFVDELFLDPSVTKVQTDPSPENERAIRSYIRAGFQAQGEVDTPDGPALLMVSIGGPP
jgi:RimJ/RimL family protein N-acetyltransferase